MWRKGIRGFWQRKLEKIAACTRGPYGETSEGGTNLQKEKLPGRKGIAERRWGVAGPHYEEVEDQERF